MPVATSAPEMRTSAPRMRGGASSDCSEGMVAVFYGIDIRVSSLTCGVERVAHLPCRFRRQRSLAPR